MKKADYSDIEKILENGPLTSEDVLNKMEGFNKRQRLNRATKYKIIQQNGDISLGKNRRIYSLPDTPIDFSDFIKNDKLSYRLIELLNIKPVITYEEASKIIGAPIEKIVGDIHHKGERRSFLDIIKNLETLKIINVNEHHKIISLPTIKITDEIAKQLSITSIISNKILNDTLMLLSKIGIIGWDAFFIKSYSDREYFNGYYFNAVAYSYTYCDYYIDSNKRKKGRPCFIDVIIDREVKEFDIIGFKTRIQNVRGMYKEKTRVTGILIVKSLDNNSLRLARKIGLVIIHLKNFWGSSISLPESLDSLNDSKISTYISSLKDERLNNVKAALFNILVDNWLKNYGYLNTKISDTFKVDREECECDITYNTTDRKTVFIFEVKAYKKNKKIKLGSSKDDKDSIKRFFERTKSIVEKSIKDDVKVVPIFITTSNFEEDAKLYMDNQKKILNIFKQNEKGLFDALGGKLYIERNKLIQLLKDKNLTESAKIIKNELN
jgi:hypothetical protein